MEYTPLLHYKITQLLKLPIWIFSISFGIGTLILLSYFYGIEIMFPLGFLFLVFAFFVNAAVAGSLLICAFLFREYQQQILLKTSILLINIPIAMIYCYLAFNHDSLFPVN